MVPIVLDFHLLWFRRFDFVNLNLALLHFFDSQYGLSGGEAYGTTWKKMVIKILIIEKLRINKRMRNDFGTYGYTLFVTYLHILSRKKANLNFKKGREFKLQRPRWNTWKYENHGSYKSFSFLGVLEYCGIIMGRAWILRTLNNPMRKWTNYWIRLQVGFQFIKKYSSPKITDVKRNLIQVTTFYQVLSLKQGFKNKRSFKKHNLASRRWSSVVHLP